MINWRVYGKDTVASLLNQEELPGFFRKRFTVNPGEAAVIIRDGRVEEVYTQSRIQTAGLMDRILKFFKAESKVEVLFLTTSPFDFTFYFEVVAADREKVAGECKISLKTNPQKADKLLGLMAGKRALAADDIYHKINHEVVAKSMVHRITNKASNVFFASTNETDQIENKVSSELRTTLENWGLVFESFTVDWCMTDKMRVEVERKSLERIEEAKDFENRRTLMEMKRELDISRTRIENLNEIKMLEASGETELKDFYLTAELGRERMRDEARVNTAEIDARIQLIRAEADHKERLLRIETRKADEMAQLDIEDRRIKQKNEERLARIDTEDKEMWSMVKMQIEMVTAKHERQVEQRRQEIQAEFNRQQVQIDADYRQRRIKLEESMARMGMQERLIAQALSSGAADAGVIKTMLEESTKQEYATTSDAKVESVYTAEAAKHDLKTFKEAEDRERMHQVDMTKRSADMMRPAKQEPNWTVVAGIPVMGGQTGQSNIHVTIPSQSKETPVAKKEADAACPNCSADIKVGWKACPYCGQSLGKQKCSSCEGELESNWKACPNCGTAI